MRLRTRTSRSNSTSGARLSLRSWVALFLQERRRTRALAHSLPGVPNAPSNLALSDGGNYIQLTWSDLSGNELGFHVYRNADFAGFVLWRILGANVTQTQDNGVLIGHVYAYYVTAYNAVGESGPTSVVQETFGA